MNLFKNILLKLNTNKWAGSAKYWDDRYVHGGNSGSGSYNNLAEFKAEILNQLVSEHQIKTVIEWGCGDGNQLSYAQYPQYLGIDVSETAIKICKKMYHEDSTKAFVSINDIYKYSVFLKGELALSLDVIYHLVEDEVYEEYMERLFKSSTRYVVIYSCNFEKNHAAHVRCRKFSDWIDENASEEWELLKVINNKYPYDDQNSDSTSWSDFYIYKKR